MSQLENWWSAVKDLVPYSAAKKDPQKGLVENASNPPLDEHGNPPLEHDYAADLGRKPVNNLSEAHLISSKVAGTEHACDGGIHKLVIDIDWPAVLVPSSTLGHFHLIIDKRIAWSQYEAILKALADANIVQPGYVKASIARGRTDIRAPWVHKDAAQVMLESANSALIDTDSRLEYLGLVMGKEVEKLPAVKPGSPPLPTAYSDGLF